MIKKPTLLQSLFPIILVIVFIAVNVLIFGNDTLSGANQIALIFSSAIAIGIALYNGVKYDKIMDSIIDTISSAMGAILILFFIGMLAGTWMLSGVIPTMKYYGLNILSADMFLPAAVVISAIISVALGSSWSTIATIGVALLGIGKTLGFSDGVIAGAIISGAYFGDKVSPISDTSNLAAAISKSELFVVIKYMMYTSLPAIALTIIIFTCISLTTNVTSSAADISDFQRGLSDIYNINISLFIIPIITIVAIAKKMPPIPVLLLGSILGGIAATIYQPELIAKLSTDGVFSAKSCYEVVAKSMFGPINIESPNELIASLTSTRGMSGMLNTIWLILCTMSFGGVLEAAGFLNRITDAIMSKVKTAKGLVTATTGSCILFNTAAGDQYLSIVIPGKMFVKSYEAHNLKGEVLARTLQDSATVTSVLVPWNSCGATQSTILGVATFTYAPFAFFCILSPLISIFVAWINFRIRRITQ